MREIKFRGKTINEPIEWVSGTAMVSKDMGEAIIFEEIIIPMEGEEDNGGQELSYHAVYVDINTVGQVTGLQDKNGDDIYEGDIVNMHMFIEVGGEEGISEGEIEIIGKIQIHDIGIYFETDKIQYDNVTYSNYLLFYAGLHEESFEIIGNIYA